MSGGGGFSIDPEALGALAAAFDRMASRLDGAVNGFCAAAEPSGDAFGLLPLAREAHRRYLARAQEGVLGIAGVRDGFATALAGGVRANRANYARADLESTVSHDR